MSGGMKLSRQLAVPGEIRDAEKARQLMLFKSLRWGKISPTNIDMLLEFNDRLFVLCEAKFGAAPLPLGQRLGLERTCAAIQASSDRVAVVFQVTHDRSDDVDLGLCTVVRYYSGKERIWKTLPRVTTLKEAIDALIEKLDLN